VSTLIERPKNVRKRKKRKVDRGFQDVARDGDLHLFVNQAGSMTSVREMGNQGSGLRVSGLGVQGSAFGVRGSGFSKTQYERLFPLLNPEP
jgi:hypothetical protein